MSQSLIKFANEICPMPNNFCDGTAIQDREEKAPEMEMCPWYDIDIGCIHPSNPKANKYPKNKRGGHHNF